MKKNLLSQLSSIFNKRQNDVHAKEETLSKKESASEANGRLRLALDTAPGIYALLVDGKLSEVSQYARNQIGMERGDDIRLFCQDAEQWNTLNDNAGRGKQTAISIRTKTGETRLFLGNLTAVDYQRQRAFILWGSDIEEGGNTLSNGLRHAQNSMRTILDAMPVPVRIADSVSGEIIYGNEVFWEMLEYDLPEERQGIKIKDLLPGIQIDGNILIEKLGLTIEAPEARFFETEYRTRTGKDIEAMVVTRKIQYQGKEATIGIIKDLAAEKEYSNMIHRLEEMERDAGQLKVETLTDISHEIVTPANGIIGMADLLLGEIITGRQSQYVTDIKKSAEFLLNMVNVILDYAKISEDKMQIIPVDLELGAFLRNILDMTRFSARAKGLAFSDNITVKSPEYVKADEMRLKQILFSLLSNAIKFTKSGSVSFFVKIEAGDILFKVSDTGIGIKPEDMQLLFSEFGRIGEHKNREFEGTGLGLFISKKLVDAMEGKIWVESEYGKGSQFYVTIPYIPGDNAAAKSTDVEFEYIHAPTAHILLVDDIQSNLTTAAGMFRLFGITADIAMSGTEAIGIVRKKNYDIIFMDYLMPEMDGVEAMKIIRGFDENHAKMPIIALTAESSDEARDYLMQAGMSDFLPKPLDKAALIEVLKKWLPAGKIETVERSEEPVQNAAYSEVLQAISLIEDIDIKHALDRIGGMQDVLESSLIQVAKSIDGNIAEMVKQLSGNSLKEFSIMIHGMKGALANIGAKHLSELAAELEILSKSGNKTLCNEKFAAFTDIMAEFSARLNDVFKKECSKDLLEGDRSQLIEKAKAAASLLEEYEIAEARSCVSEMLCFTYGEAADKLLNDIKDTIAAANYDKAIAMLANVIEVC